MRNIYSVFSTMFLTFVLGFSVLASAGMHEKHDHPDEIIPMSTFIQTAEGGKVITVHVKGMDCDYCGRSLARKMKAKSEVRDVVVNVGMQRVTIALEKGARFSEAKVKRCLKNYGIHAEKIMHK